MIAWRRDKSFWDINIPELTNDKFEDFDLDFQGNAMSKVGLSVIPLECLLLSNDVVNYDECKCFKKFTLFTK